MSARLASWIPQVALACPHPRLARLRPLSSLSAAAAPVNQPIPLTATLRPVPPVDPASPTVRNVSDAAGLQAALDAAAPGHVILLADGTYAGPFSFTAGGTAANPIVIRGASEDGVVLDGRGCSSCNVLEAYGSFVHVERLTLAHAHRGLRFQGVGAQGNVVRR